MPDTKPGSLSSKLLARCRGMSAKRCCGYLAGAVLLLALSAGIWQSNRAWSDDAPPLRIGYQNSPPYQEIGKDGEIGGVGNSLVKEAAARLGIKLEWVYSPNSPDFHLSRGDVDLWPIVTDLPHRREAFYLSKPIYQNALGLLYLEGSDILSPADTVGKKVAYWDREPGTTLVKKLFPKAELMPLPSHVAAIDAVFEKESEAAFIWSTKRNAIDFKQAIDEHPETAYRFYYFPDKKITCSIAASFGNPSAVRAANLIREEIGNLALGGKAQEVYFKYYLDPENEISSYFYADNLQRKNYWLAGAISFLVVLAAVLAYTAYMLKRSQIAAYAAMEAKSQFLANMSHEVRTPLNGIMGMTQLAMTSSHDEDQKSMLHIVMQSADALLTIVNDILDLSKIEAGKLSLEPSPIVLQDLLGSTMPFFEVIAEQKKVEFDADVSADCPNAFLGDALRLRQILFNLVGNAVKFTMKGSIKVRVSLLPTRELSYLLFEVEDTGIGIPEERLDHIFEAFSQVDSSNTRNFGGTGLGLTISRNLVKLMGGEIRVESVVDRGSVFSFTIPFLPVGSVSPAPVVSTLPTSFNALRILVVEDNEINLNATRSILYQMGHKVTTAQNGLEATKVYGKARFDVILMDIHMPNMDGWETTRQIRRLEIGSQKRVPIIALTATDMNDEKRERVTKEMDGFIAKPLKVSELKQELGRVVPPVEPS